MGILLKQRPKPRAPEKNIEPSQRPSERLQAATALMDGYDEELCQDGMGVGQDAWLLPLGGHLCFNLARGIRWLGPGAAKGRLTGNQCSARDGQSIVEIQCR